LKSVASHIEKEYFIFGQMRRGQIAGRTALRTIQPHTHSIRMLAIASNYHRFVTSTQNVRPARSTHMQGVPLPFSRPSCNTCGRLSGATMVLHADKLYSHYLILSTLSNLWMRAHIPWKRYPDKSWFIAAKSLHLFPGIPCR
jgi:hypothetical protein